jgi:DNA-binding MarR family transcriptional regulator
MNTTVTRPRPLAKPAPARFYRGDAYRSDESVGLLMRRAAACMAQNVDRRLDEHDLTHAQWAPLFKIAHGHASTVAELARECDCDAGAMTRMLDRLEAKGLLRRLRSEEDRRVVNVVLTPDGERIAAHIPFVLADVQNEMLAGFKREEWLALRGYLERMLANGGGVKGRGCAIEEEGA